MKSTTKLKRASHPLRIKDFGIEKSKSKRKSSTKLLDSPQKKNRDVYSLKHTQKVIKLGLNTL